MKSLNLVLAVWALVPAYSLAGDLEANIGIETLLSTIDTKETTKTNETSSDFNWLNTRIGVNYFIHEKLTIRGGLIVGMNFNTTSQLTGYFLGGTWTPLSTMQVKNIETQELSYTSLNTLSWYLGLDIQQYSISASDISLTFTGLRAETGLRRHLNPKESVSFAALVESMLSGSERSSFGFGGILTYNIAVNF